MVGWTFSNARTWIREGRSVSTWRSVELGASGYRSCGKRGREEGWRRQEVDRGSRINWRRRLRERQFEVPRIYCIPVGFLPRHQGADALSERVSLSIRPRPAKSEGKKGSDAKLEDRGEPGSGSHLLTAGNDTTLRRP